MKKTSIFLYVMMIVFLPITAVIVTLAFLIIYPRNAKEQSQQKPTNQEMEEKGNAKQCYSANKTAKEIS